MLASSSLLGFLALDMAIQAVGFLAAWALRTEKFYDLFGSATFLTLVWRSVLSGGGGLAPRQWLLTAMVTLWALRLGTFLFARVMKTGGDKRFEKALTQPATLGVYWALQGVWVFVTLLPTLLVLAAPGASQPGWGWADAAGAAIWAAGWLIESVADAQKFAFKMDPANEGRFIDSGLWATSRHPNYFGEICCWWGVLAVAAGGLPPATAALAAGSPAFVMLLILRVSGVPILERNADKKWGGRADYQDYKRRTNCVVPLPFVSRL